MIATTPDLDSAVLVDGTLYIRDLVETDEDVIHVVTAADDPVDGTRQCLRIGARAIRAVSATVDTHIVEKRFDIMSHRFDTQVVDVVDQISSTARALLDEEDGSLATTLTAHRDQLETLLGTTFDPDCKNSVFGLFEAAMRESHDRQADAMRKLIAVDGDDSPLARLKVEMSRDLREQLVGVRDEVHEISKAIAVDRATAEVFELTTQKGFRYEDAVHAAVGAIASAHGDQAEMCGTELGSAGTKKGDEVVTLNADDTYGLEGRFVIEAKNQKLGVRKTTDELDAALVNRDALAAIAVFSTQDQAPTAVPFHYTGNKAVVVFDAEGSDDSAIRLAYMWARWVVRRELAVGEAEGLDLECVKSLIGRASQALAQLTQIKKCHTLARKGIDDAQAAAISMVTDVNDALTDLEAELA